MTWRVWEIWMMTFAKLLMVRSAMLSIGTLLTCLSDFEQLVPFMVPLSRTVTDLVDILPFSMTAPLLQSNFVGLQTTVAKVSEVASRATV
jgi:hypothetical protein